MLNDWLLVVFVVLLTIAIAAAVGLLFLLRVLTQKMQNDIARQLRDFGDKSQVTDRIQKHFAPAELPEIAIGERNFPVRMRVDLQREIDRLLSANPAVTYFSGIRTRSREGAALAECLAFKSFGIPLFTPPEYEDVDIGEAQPVRCLKSGVWFWEEAGEKLVALLSLDPGCGPLRFQIAVVNNPAGLQLAQQYLQKVETAVQQASCYRGKILSLERSDRYYSGVSTGITVHQLHTVNRDQVILPRTTVDLLDRNVIQFARQRPELARLGQTTKKGLLLYGPPGTGKTHTIHYLARALPGHTMFLISAEQVDWLAEYMILARLMQPSIVVLEDVDLIARDRGSMHHPGQESLLNKLLNEMDGLKPNAEILFLLTTNRPEVLEAAIASRPGRIDQAIEFPLPDDEGRRKLLQLYAGNLVITDEVADHVVARTEKVSAAFIKELVRRSAQFHLEHNGTETLLIDDIDQALDEMLFTGGSLNLKLLGAEGRQLGFATA